MSLAPAMMLTLALCAAGPAQKGVKANISVELITAERMPVTASKDWYDLFTELGVSGLTIRSAGEKDEVSVEAVGRKDAPSYRVKGILRGNNVLYLPNGRFGLKDRAGLKQWLDNLADLGVAGVAEQRSAFGLLPAQLQEINADLSQQVNFSTVGKTAAEFVNACASQLKFAVAVDPAVVRDLQETKLTDELKGLSSGTALAAALRPAGLVLEPQRPAGGEIRYRIGKPAGGRESWPVGWKPQAANAKVLPQRFESIDVEINATPLTEALDGIAEQLKVAMLFDHNALALHGIDPAKVEVKLPPKKLSYSLIIQKILGQARLKCELRVDEAGQPFYWITTIKPA